MKSRRIILASGSPRRTALLKQIGFVFRVHPSHGKEVFDRRRSPSANVKRIALKKAREVARHYQRGVVIGADTIVVLGKKVLGKPPTASRAQQMLRMLSGKEHSVLTGFALVDASSGKSMVGSVRTKVKFRKLGDKEIAFYVASGSPMDKAGAYGIQDDYGAVFVEKVNGCFYNVVGFPLAEFFQVYQRFLAQLNHGRS